MVATIDKVKLANGLHLVVNRLPHLHTVSVNVRADAGARHETPEQAGLAHLVEHLVFQGTHRWPSSFALTSQIESLGGDMFGATHTEYTSYWLNVPRDYLLEALPVFWDVLRNPLFVPQSIENEKAVVLNELMEANEQGWQQAQVLLDKALWADHPLEGPVLGKEETIRRLGTEDVLAFFGHHYAPGRMTAAIVGDVQLDEILASLDDAWSDWSTGLPSTQYGETGWRSHSPLLHQNRDEGLLHLMLGFKTLPLDDSDFGACLVLRTLLAEGMSSRLYTVLRGDAGLCYHLDSDLDELRHTCVLAIYLSVQPDRVLEVLGKVWEVFQALSSQRISEMEFERSRRHAIGKLLMSADRATHHARLLALSTYLTGHTLSVEEEVAQLEHVTLDDLCRVASRILHPEDLHAAFVGPLNERVWQQCMDMSTSWSSLNN